MNKTRKKLNEFVREKGNRLYPQLGNSLTYDITAPAYLLVAGALTSLVLTCAITIGRIPLEIAQKKLFNEKKQTYTATLREIGEYQLAQTKGFLLYGDFEIESGRVRRVDDRARVLEGKLFENIRMPLRKNIGKTYELKTIGSEKTGYTLLKARLVE